LTDQKTCNVVDDDDDDDDDDAQSSYNGEMTNTEYN